MKIAAVRIRGRRKLAPDITDTMNMMNLNRANHCVLVEDTPQNLGMLQKCKDYVAYGAVDGATVEGLLKKRGERGGKMLRDVMEGAEIKEAANKIMHGESVKNFADPVFRLHPPRKGYRDIKKPFGDGGELGKRDEMDSLIRRMM